MKPSTPPTHNRFPSRHRAADAADAANAARDGIVPDPVSALLSQWSEVTTDTLKGLSSKDADLIALILRSQHIPVGWERQNNGERVDLVVAEDHLHKIGEILAAYRSENRFRHHTIFFSSGVAPWGRHSPTIDARSKWAAGITALLLCLVHATLRYHGNHDAVVARYGASALYILQGELYRTITALTLHSDIEHLAGNVVGVLLLLPPLSALLGVGPSLFLTLTAGATGNLINAFLYGRAHLSIGASTAVMAMIGLLTAWQSKRWIQTKGHDGAGLCHGEERSPGMKRIDIHPFILLPLGAGATLTTLLSGGENTDVTGHLMGFLSGLGMGYLFLWGRLATHLFPSRKGRHALDGWLAGIAFIVVVLAWFKVWQIG